MSTSSLQKSSQKTKPATRAWQRMLSGRRLDLIDPHAIDIEIEDIALGLSRVARWNGQTKGEHGFNVAQHSLIVEGICGFIVPNLPAPFRLMALLHDAAEYVIGDMISPFKAALGVDYKRFELQLEQAIHIRFGLVATMPAKIKKLIKQADHACAFFEATQLVGFSESEAKLYFGTPPEGYYIELKPLDSATSKELFVSRFNELIDQL